MTARVLALALGVLIAAVFIGSGLAALANVPSSDPCLDFRGLSEDSSSSGSFEYRPIGTRCEYYVGGHLARSAFFGPRHAELYAWIVVAAVIGALAVLKRDTAFARGAAVTVTLLGLIGVAWHYAGVQLAFITAVLVGPPVAFALDHVLRPSSTRSRRSSTFVAVVLAAILFCAPLAVIVVPRLGMVLAVLAGALASMRITRWLGSPTN